MLRCGLCPAVPVRYRQLQASPLQTGHCPYCKRPALYPVLLASIPPACAVRVCAGRGSQTQPCKCACTCRAVVEALRPLLFCCYQQIYCPLWPLCCPLWPLSALLHIPAGSRLHPLYKPFCARFSGLHESTIEGLPPLCVKPHPQGKQYCSRLLQPLPHAA